MDEALIAKVEAGFESVGEKLEAVKLRDALSEALRLATEANIYLENAPWFGKTIKEDKPAAATTMYTALRCIDNLKISVCAIFAVHFRKASYYARL